jgi:hypothetical protein
MKKRIFCIISLLVLMATACNLASGSPTSVGTPNSNTPVGEPTQPQDTPTAQPTATPPAQPVSMNDEMGMLNSFEIKVAFKSSGPGKNQSSSITNTTDYSKDQDARYIQLNSSVTAIGDTTPTNTDLQIYRIGNAMCSSSEKNVWDWTNQDPGETEMLELTQNIITMAPLIDNPTFVGAETVNDIPSNHFTFKVSGLGVKSGYEVTSNQGDYWVATDGQYIVKYTLVMETHDGSNKKVLHEEISIDVSQINQPVAIAFPAACLKIQKPTPTP